MSHQATAWVAERSEAKGSELLVMYVIANHAHPDGTGSWPSTVTIAKESRMSERGVRYIIQRLTEMGEIVVSRHRSTKPDSFSGQNEYTIPGVLRDGFWHDKDEVPEEKIASGRQGSGKAAATERQPSGNAEANTVPMNLNLEEEVEPEETVSLSSTKELYKAMRTVFKKRFGRKLGPSVLRGVTGEKFVDAHQRYRDRLWAAFEEWLSEGQGGEYSAQQKYKMPIALFVKDVDELVDDAGMAGPDSPEEEGGDFDSRIGKIERPKRDI